MHDFHTHFIPNDVLNWIKENKNTVNAEWIKKEANKDDFLFINQKWGFEVKKAFIDFDLYMRDQQQANVTHSMISAIPQLFLYDFPVEVTTEMSRIYNQSLAKLVARQPDKLSAVGTVPLSHPVKAAEVLQEAMSMGLKGCDYRTWHRPTYAVRQLFPTIFRRS